MNLNQLLAFLLAAVLIPAKAARGDQPQGITVSGSGQVKSKPTDVEIGAMVSGGVGPGEIFATKASSDPAWTGCTVARVAQSVESVHPVMNIVPIESTAMSRE